MAKVTQGNLGHILQLISKSCEVRVAAIVANRLTTSSNECQELRILKATIVLQLSFAETAITISQRRLG